MSRLLKLIIACIIFCTLIGMLVFLMQDVKFHSSNKKYIILTFDDGWSSQYEAYKTLKPLQIKGTLYICSGLIGQKNRLTINNLAEMYNSGWDICNHTVNHVNLKKVSLEKAYDEIYGCSSWIAGHGFTRNMDYKHFAYPEGAYNQGIMNILMKQNILTARTTTAGNDTSDFFQLGRMSLYGMSKKSIRDNIISDKKLLILSLHTIIPDNSTQTSEIDLKESYFKEVIDSIIESKRVVLTITEWYKLRNSHL